MSPLPARGPSFDIVAAELRAAITAHITPAVTIEVGTTSVVLWQHADGQLTYAPDALPCRVDTVFDLASLTKVIATTSLALRIAEQDHTWLSTKVAALEPEWNGGDRSAVTVRDLLEHASGLPAHVRLFESISGRDAFLKRICAEPLAFAPRTESRYSDLGFILLGLLIERSLSAPLDVLFKSIAARIAGPLLFNPPSSLAPAIAPTEVDVSRGGVVQGQVHDENAAALGGVAGHAGLFGTARAVGSFAQTILQSFSRDTWLARADTMHTFTARSTVPGSSRALGWDTMLITSSCGTKMSPRAIGHTGFTGTSLWMDPAHDVYVVLLTNRVHPSRDHNGIQELRRSVHDAVMDVVLNNRV